MFEHKYAGECAICGRGAEFRDAAWLFLMVFIALNSFPHRVFPLRPDVWDLPTAPRLANSKLRLYRELPTPPWFRFMVMLPFSLSCTNFVDLCNIFVYCRANYFLAWSQLLWIHHISSSAEIYIFFSLFHWTLQYNLLKSQLLPLKRERGSLAWESGLITNRLAETAFVLVLSQYCLAEAMADFAFFKKAWVSWRSYIDMVFLDNNKKGLTNIKEKFHINN